MAWKPYSERRKRHSHDFEVRYRFFEIEKGGRKIGPPRQGYRSDFLYEGDDPTKDPIWAIWPEFEDAQKNVILDEDIPVPSEGTARMWILNDETRAQHRARLKVGTKGFFVEGPFKVATCEVIAINGLSAEQENLSND